MHAQPVMPPVPTVRPATRADLAFVAWCNYEASSPAPGFCYWDPLVAPLGSDSLTFIQAVFAHDALAWGTVEDFRLIEAEGTPIGGASGFSMSADDYRPLRLDRLAQVAAALGWTDAQHAQFLAGYSEVWHDPHDETLAPSGSYTIECVAVVPEARGRGAAKQLLRAMLDEARAAGHADAGIAVTLGNDAAQRVYEALGFRPYVTYWGAYFDDAFPGTQKYRLALSGA